MITSAEGAPAGGDFRPFSCDKLLLGVRRRPAPWLILAWAVVLGVLTLINHLQGTLTHPRGVRVLLDDLAFIFGSGDEVVDDTRFPLLRDVPALTLTTFIALNTYLLVRQWGIMSRLLSSLISNKIVETSDDRVFPRMAAYANRKFDAFGRGRAPVIIAFLVALLISFALQGSGVFWPLAPDGLASEDLQQWTHQAYENWWASFSTSKGGFVAYVMIAWIGVYYVLAQNWVGIIVCRAFWKHRHDVKFRLNFLNPDGYFGWDIPRRCLWTVYMSISISAMSLVLIFQVISLREVIWLLPLLLIFVLFNPPYLILPVYLVARDLSRHKQMTIHALRARFPASEGEASYPTDPEAFERWKQTRDEIDYVRKISILPFKTRQVVGAILLYAIPAVATALQLAEVF